MMAGNLSIEQREWSLKEYWKTENSERVRTAWVEEFNLLKPNDIYIYIYMSYRSANLQTLHFKYLFNKYTY